MDVEVRAVTLYVLIENASSMYILPIAFPNDRKPEIFLISVRVPKESPGRFIEILASTRIAPSARSKFRYDIDGEVIAISIKIKISTN